jgi:hypothetical protein
MLARLKRALGVGGNVVYRRQLALVTFAALLVSSAAHADAWSDSCDSARKSGSIFKLSSQTTGWNEIEAATEKPFQEVIGADEATRTTLANLNEKLNRYGWTLTRYTVQLLHELNAETLTVASERLGDDAYASRALSDAMWDGFNGWSIVSSLQLETLEILNRLEAVRAGGGDKALVSKAQKVAQRLLKEAANAEESTALAATCDRPQGLKLGA